MNRSLRWMARINRIRRHMKRIIRFRFKMKRIIRFIELQGGDPMQTQRTSQLSKQSQKLLSCLFLILFSSVAMAHKHRGGGGREEREDKCERSEKKSGSASDELASKSEVSEEESGEEEDGEEENEKRHCGEKKEWGRSEKSKRKHGARSKNRKVSSVAMTEKGIDAQLADDPEVAQ